MLVVEDAKLLREENARLKTLLAEKEEEIIQLREALRPVDWLPPAEIGLTSSQARIIACLYGAKGEVTSKERLYHALYHDQNVEREIKIVDVMICKMRKKLIEYGIEIKTAWGRGHYLDKTSLDILATWGLGANEEISVA